MEYEIKITGSGTLQQLKDALAAIAANIDTNEDYSNGYEDEGPYLMTEINTCESEDEFVDEWDWVCTDEDSGQYRRRVGPFAWEFKESRIVDPISGQEETYQEIINLVTYSTEARREACAAYGYSAKEVANWWFNNENLEIIAECIFEQSN